jgi:hypothetical protein
MSAQGQSRHFGRIPATSGLHPNNGHLPTDTVGPFRANSRPAAFGAVVIRVRQIVQRHFGGNPWQRLHQEVACGPVQKGMLDHLAPAGKIFLPTWRARPPSSRRVARRVLS